MTLKRWNPNGTDGADVVVTGTPLDQVLIVGGGTAKYETSAGAQRGNEVGVEFLAPLATDQAAVAMAETAAAAGANQAYWRWLEWPLGNALVEFLRLRSGTVASGANIIRFLVATSDHATLADGTIVCQNAAGTTIGTLGAVALNTWYRYGVAALPGTTTSNGAGDAWIHNDDDSLLYQLNHPAADLNMGTAQVTRAAFGKLATTGTNFKGQGTQFAIDTGASIPTIPPVAKNAPPPTITGNFPKVLVAGVWT